MSAILIDIVNSIWISFPWIDLHKSLNQKPPNLVQKFSPRLTCVKFLLDSPPLSDVIDGDQRSADEEHQTRSNGENERNDFPIPDRFFTAVESRRLSRQTLHRRLLMVIRPLSRQRLAPVDLDGVQRLAKCVHVPLAWPNDDLVFVALRARSALVVLHVPILAMAARGRS